MRKQQGTSRAPSHHLSTHLRPGTASSMNGSGGKSSHRACPTLPVPATFPPALSSALSQMPSVEDIVNKAIQIQQQQQTQRQTISTTSSIPSPLPQAPPSSPVEKNPEVAQSEVPLPPQQQVESNESASGQPSLETPSESRPKKAPRAPRQAKRQREEDPAVQQSLPIPPVLAEEAAPPQVLEEQAPRPPSPPIPKKSSQPAPRSILKMRKPAKEGDPETAFLLQKDGPAVPGFVVCSEDLKTGEGRPFEGFRINSMSWQLIFPANTPGVGGKLITGFTKFPEVASCGACGWGQENFDLK